MKQAMEDAVGAAMKEIQAADNAGRDSGVLGVGDLRGATRSRLERPEPLSCSSTWECSGASVPTS